jgi:hypothetical protein
MKRVASIRFVKPVKTVAPGTAPPVPDIFDGCFLSLDHRHHLPFTGRSHQPVVAVLADFIAGTIVWCAMIIEGCDTGENNSQRKEITPAYPMFSAI